jgi:hypothetical protein
MKLTSQMLSLTSLIPTFCPADTDLDFRNPSERDYRTEPLYLRAVCP